MSNAELASSYAALILADEGLEITEEQRKRRTAANQTHRALLARARKAWSINVAAQYTYTILYEQADKLQSLISAAKVQDIEPIWTTLFAKALEGKDVKDLLVNVGSGGGAAPAAGGAAPAAGGASDAPAAEEKKEEEKEESDDDMGFGLFD
ncbi:hypothetical protein Q7P36_010621 [Cladosporium allicinum]